MDKNKIIEGAAKLVAKGAYDKAIKEYQKVLEADPKDVRILQKMGELYQKKNDNSQAAFYFTKVAESYSNDGFFPRRLPLSWNGPWANPHLGVPGTTVGVRIQDLPFPDLQSDRPNHFISVLHGDGMPLDADFAGLVLDGVTVGQAAIDALWQNDQWPPGTLNTPPTPAALSDGNQGGTVTAYFDYAERL